MKMEEIKKQAELELQLEEFREAVDKYKAKLKKRKWWHNFVPFKIVIIRRSEL